MKPTKIKKQNKDGEDITIRTLFFVILLYFITAFFMFMLMCDFFISDIPYSEQFSTKITKFLPDWLWWLDALYVIYAVSGTFLGGTILLCLLFFNHKEIFNIKNAN